MQQSILQFNFRLVRDGLFNFTFEVDSEVGYDGMYVMVTSGSAPSDAFVFPADTEGEFNEDRNTVFTAEAGSSASIPLAAGAHEIQFIYEKDWSVSENDIAIVSKVYIQGNQYSATACTDCAGGTHSAAGSARCNSCDENQVGGVDGECVHCAPDEYALFTSAACEARSECTTSDYFAHHAACVNSLRETYYEWFAPRVSATTVPPAV